MDFTAIWPVIAGLGVPFVIGYLSKQSWKAWVKALFTVGVSAILGFATVIFGEGIEFTATNAILIVSATVGAAAVSFWEIVKNVPGLQQWLYDHGIKDKQVGNVEDKV